MTLWVSELARAQTAAAAILNHKLQARVACLRDPFFCAECAKEGCISIVDAVMLRPASRLASEMNNIPSTLLSATHQLKRILSAVLLLGSLAVALAPSARAQITINFVYNGTDTTLNFNVAAGSLASLTSSGTASTSQEHSARNGGLASVMGPVFMDTYVNPGFANPSWGSPIEASSFSGDGLRFFVGSSGVRVPTGFDRVNGTLAGSMTWTNLSLIGLGFASDATTSGSFAALGTTVNWSATNSAIPEPSTYAALFVGLAALGVSAVRRRIKRTKRTGSATVFQASLN